jgi:7-keto-8-aminopelargonate synthetase-like enzyme
MRLIVVEGLYSLDGDIAPLAEIVELAERYDCTLMVDEAHAIGVLGENGTGACELCKVANHVDIVMGTFGKALGSYGAFVAGSEQLKRFLVNKTRPLIYTTALPPAVLAASRAAIEIVREEPWRRRETLTKAAYLRQGLSEIGFDVGVSAAQIVPVIVGAAEQALQLAQALLDLGVFVQPIRPPTVPPGTSRLRVTVNAEHSYEQLNTALDAFGNARERLRNNVQAGVEQP